MRNEIQRIFDALTVNLSALQQPTELLRPLIEELVAPVEKLVATRRINDESRAAMDLGPVLENTRRILDR
jgi:hypothetical protein